MKTLFKLSLTDCICSLAPALLWMLFGVLLGQDYANGYILSYPMQYVIGILFQVLIIGSLKLELKEPGNNYFGAGWTCYMVTSIIMVLFIGLGCNWILSVSKDADSLQYNMFVLGVAHLCCNSAVSSLTKKYQYMSENKKAIKLALSWHVWSISVFVLIYVFMHKYVHTMSMLIIHLLVMELSLVIIWLRCPYVKQTHLSLKGCIKYSSAAIPSNIGMAATYFLSVYRLSLSPIALAAYNTMSMCTDTQWDALSSVDTYTSMEAVTGEWTNKSMKVLKEVVKYSLVLLCSSIVMFVAYANTMEVDLFKMSAVFFKIEMNSYLLYAYSMFLGSYLQINGYSKFLSMKTTVQYVTRFLIVLFIPSVYWISWACFIVCFIGLAMLIPKYSKVYNGLKGDGGSYEVYWNR